MVTCLDGYGYDLGGRIRLLATACHRWIVATTRTETRSHPHPTPPNRRNAARRTHSSRRRRLISGY